MRRAAIITLALVTLPSIAFADPSPISTPHSQFVGLIAEALLLAAILYNKGFDPVRIFYSWGLVTFVTFMMLFGSSRLFDRLAARKVVSYSQYDSFLFFAEVAVVLIEALVLFRMVRFKFFWLKEVQLLPFGRALRYSVIVNITSFVSGVLWTIFGEPLFEAAISRFVR